MSPVLYRAHYYKEFNNYRFLCHPTSKDAPIFQKYTSLYIGLV